MKITEIFQLEDGDKLFFAKGTKLSIRIKNKDNTHTYASFVTEDDIYMSFPGKHYCPDSTLLPRLKPSWSE